MTRANALLPVIAILLTQLVLGGIANAQTPTIAHWVHGKEHKETVVLIHGFISSHATWNTLVPKLSKKYRVVVYDQPGHGLSPASGLDYSPKAMATQLKDLLDYLKIDKLHLVGHSMGGRTVVNFASLYPEMVSSVVVEDMNFLEDADLKARLPHIRAQYTKVQAAIPGTFPSREAAIKALSVFYNEQEIYFLLASMTSDADGTVRMNYRPEVTYLYLAEGLSLDMTEALQSVRARLAFFAADAKDQSTVLKGEGLEHVRKTRPEALVKEFAGSGHTIHDRADFAEATLEFLAR